MATLRESGTAPADWSRVRADNRYSMVLIVVKEAAEGAQNLGIGPGPPGAVKRPSRFPRLVEFCMAFLYGAEGA